MRLWAQCPWRLFVIRGTITSADFGKTLAKERSMTDDKAKEAHRAQAADKAHSEAFPDFVPW